MDAGESDGSTNGIRAELNVVKKVTRTISRFNSASPRAPRRGQSACRTGRHLQSRGAAALAGERMYSQWKPARGEAQAQRRGCSPSKPAVSSRCRDFAV